MNDYNKNFFWTFKNENNEIKYYFKINGKLVEVSKDVYSVCFNSYRKMLFDNKRNVDNGLLSLDYENESGNSLLSSMSSEDDVIANVNRNLLINQVYKELATLDELDQQIIIGVYVNEETERSIAEKLNIPQPTLHKRKIKAIEKIKDRIKNL